MNKVTVNQQVIAYTEQGNGRPILLLHANPGEHDDFRAVIPGLAEHFRVLALDWPGYGASPPPNPPQSASAFMYATLLQAFIRQLDLYDVVLLGNSVGGFAAVCAALEMPDRVRALVLVSPGGFTAHNSFTRLFCRLQGSEWLTKHTVRSFARWYLHGDTAVTQEMLQRAATSQKSETAVAVNAAIWRSFAQPEHDLRQRAAQIQCPTLVVSGSHDPVIPANKDGKIATESIPQARQVILDTGHAPFAEDPDAFLQVVNSFFTENHLIEATKTPIL